MSRRRADASDNSDMGMRVNIAADRAAAAIQSIRDLEAQLRYAEAFRKRNGRPFIAVSYAQSIDGSIASRDRDPIALSGPQSSVLTHRIRACCDSILVGIGTVLADDPQLSVRRVKGKNPLPIVLDTRLRIPLGAKLVARAESVSLIIAGPQNGQERRRAVEAAGAKPLTCATGEDGRIDLVALMALLAETKINSVMVEGGARVITSFLRARLVDQFIITLTPRLIGGLQVIDADGFRPADCLDLDHVHYQRLDDDIIMWARPAWRTE